ncbi:hypothetical protein DMENIID0001_111040 [Sergentomyia squamirostris]
MDHFEKNILNKCNIKVTYGQIFIRLWIDLTISTIYCAVLILSKIPDVYRASYFVIGFVFILAIVDLDYIYIVCYISFTIRALKCSIKSVRVHLEQKSERSPKEEFCPGFRSFNLFFYEYLEIKNLFNQTFGYILSFDIAYDFFVFTISLYLYLRTVDKLTSNLWLWHLGPITHILGKLIKVIYFTTQTEQLHKELEALERVVVTSNPLSGSSAILQSFLHSNQKKYFTAAGFFDINYKLTYQFLTTCFTYMHTLVMISFTVPQIIYQVNILSIFAKGEQHANVFRQIVKFEETFREVFKTPVDFTSWTFWTYVDYIIAAVYWLVVYILKTQYYQFENFLVFIYHLTLALLDLNSLFIVCHIRSTVRCLRTFQEYLLTISREIQEEAESHSGSELRNLHIQSRQLKNLKRKINETFGPLLLVSIVYDFVVLVFQLYFYLRYIFRYHALSQVGQIIKILGFVCKASVYVTEMEEYYQEV